MGALLFTTKCTMSEFGRTFPFSAIATTAIPNKILGINLNKEVKKLYSENHGPKNKDTRR